MLRAVLALALALAASAELITFHSQVRADEQKLGLPGARNVHGCAAPGWPALHKPLTEVVVSHGRWLSNMAWRRNYIEVHASQLALSSLKY